MKLQDPKKRQIIRYLGLIAVIIPIALVIGCLIPTKWRSSEKLGCEFEICVEDVGIHTNIILPIKNEAFDWDKHLSLRELGKSYRYLSFGWGDRLFYIQTPTSADFKLSNALDALLTPGPSVMYVQGITNLSETAPIKCVKLNRQDYLSLVKYVQDSFQLDNRKQAIFAANGYNANGSFYEAKGTYSIFKTCNVWTGEALRSADLNTPLWTALAPAIMWHFKSDCGAN
jgi:uncharacterized protein (TIGR02117 family)